MVLQSSCTQWGVLESYQVVRVQALCEILQEGTHETDNTDCICSLGW